MNLNELLKKLQFIVGDSKLANEVLSKYIDPHLLGFDEANLEVDKLTLEIAKELLSFFRGNLKSLVEIDEKKVQWIVKDSGLATEISPFEKWKKLSEDLIKTITEKNPIRIKEE